MLFKYPSRLSWAVGVMSIMAAGSAARADLPPQFAVWEEWQAIMQQGDIPNKLGYVERIEEVWNSTFRLYSGNCYMDAEIQYRDTSKGTGRIIPDGVVISGVKLGEVICQ